MAQRSSRTQHNNLPVELGIDPQPQIAYTKVTNLLGSTVIRYGSYSGRKYVWEAGQSLFVQKEDANEMRNLRLGGRPCCAGGNANLIFEVLED
jgi:hypothetical protein